MSDDPTFDPSEWITLNEAAEIVRRESDSTDDVVRWRLVRLLQQLPGTARVVTATLPGLARSRAGLMPLPDRCQWVSIDEIDWSTSEVRAFPFLSGTDWENWYPPDKMLGVRVPQAKLMETVRQKHSPRSIQELEALPSSTLRWLYELLPPPSPLELRLDNWAHEREQAKRILAQRDREKPAAPTQAEAAAIAAYFIDWEPLPAAVARLKAFGVSEDQAKLTLCRMISDKMVAVRLTIAEGTSDITGMFVGPNIKVPVHLKPDDFDWEKSRPLAPWSIGPYLLQRFLWKPRLVSLIDVRPRDIIEWAGKLSGQVNNTMPRDGGGDHPREQQAREWRVERLKRFTESQRRKREWINFAEIAEWCSEVGGSVVPNEDARASAYEKLQRDFLDSYFEENGRSRVLYLHPWTVKAKMTRGRLQDLIEASSPTTIRSKYFNHCWLPRNLFQRWLARHEMPVRPQRFEPEVETPSQPTTTWQGEPLVLKPAPKHEIRAAIKAAYDAAHVAGQKPPNIKELPAAVLPRLEEKGYRASGRSIQQVGDSPEFKHRRRRPGKTISSEQRAK